MLSRLGALVFSVILVDGVAAQAAKTKIAVLSTYLEGSAKDQVPSLIDDYILTAVQDAGTFEVVGPDDVNALLGFEKQKELLGCDDVTCMTDIAGALGVDKILVFKVARVEDEWVTTAKLLNVRETRVERRTTEMILGTATDLLRAVPGVVAKLFGRDSAAGAIKPGSEATAARAATTKPIEPAVMQPAVEVPIYKNWWFWGAIGAVAVVTTGVVVVALSAPAGDDKNPVPLDNEVSTGAIVQPLIAF
ncbi:MAG: hypothetical protein V3T05_02960 [Myxococcota bacterium]